jgi:hypothetical protein
MILDLDQIENDISKIIQNLSKAKLLNNKLIKIRKFIHSEIWKKLHDLPGGYDILNQFVSNHFKYNIIKSNEVILHGNKFYNLLNNKQKEFINKVDQNKDFNFYKYNNLITIYIGSINVLFSSNDETIDITEYQEEFQKFLINNDLTEDHIDQYLDDIGITKEEFKYILESNIQDTYDAINKFNPKDMLSYIGDILKYLPVSLVSIIYAILSEDNYN